ncbi:hypothetical protein LDJ94_01200 [Fusobacterium nucleatum]|uniref:hypothetical protein n=1 Tax=Fusobacterium nucleatum TaxID=851 RepID=UPI0030CF7159
MNIEVLFYLLISLLVTVYVVCDSFYTKRIDCLVIITILLGILDFCVSLYTLLNPC